jgi:hypothetical protein
VTGKSEQAAGQRAPLPLPALLSQVLVAFTIEADNELEHQLPHRTTRGPAAGSHRGPWLVSLVMWSNFLRFVGEDGVPVRELPALAGMSKDAIDSQLTRMGKWWGYVTVGPDPADRRSAAPRPRWGGPALAARRMVRGAQRAGARPRRRAPADGAGRARPGSGCCPAGTRAQ